MCHTRLKLSLARVRPDNILSARSTSLPCLPVVNSGSRAPGQSYMKTKVVLTWFQGHDRALPMTPFCEPAEGVREDPHMDYGPTSSASA